MNSTTTLPFADGDAVGRTLQPSASRSSLRWITPLIVFGAACITFGVLWDISWHSTIGRDTFWTPAHMVLYMGGTLSGCLAGWLAIEATFLKRDSWRGLSVNLYGGRAPLGAWVCIWSAIAMLTSAPLDDWWHSAYGLDVKILSPPHSLLALGMYGIATGVVMLVAAQRNRAAAAGQGSEGALWVVVANAIQLALSSVMLIELSFPNVQHTSTFAMASAAMYPGFLVAAARHAPVRWSATKVALGYMLILGSMVWVLPLFHAEPKLAPIFNRVDHMVPPSFPLLLVVPALAIDLVFAALRRRTHWAWTPVRIVSAALLFVGLFLSTQWYFSIFLISPASGNAFFAGHGRFFSYLGNLDFAGRFMRLTEHPLTSSAVAWSALIALASTTVGLGTGSFLSRIRR